MRTWLNKYTSRPAAALSPRKQAGASEKFESIYISRKHLCKSKASM